MSFYGNEFIDKKTAKNTLLNFNQGLLNKKTKKDINKNINPRDKKKKKKLSYALENNVISIYNSKIPVIQTSKKINVLSEGPSGKKSLLKKSKPISAQK